MGQLQMELKVFGLAFSELLAAEVTIHEVLAVLSQSIWLTKVLVKHFELIIKNDKNSKLVSYIFTCI